MQKNAAIKRASGEEMRPAVSVIMPVYNGEKYIAQAVQSVYAQNIPLELIVLDDGSVDGTWKALIPWENRPDFCLYKNERNLSAAGSRNRGVSVAKGRYVAFLDADDWWEEGKLAAQLAALEMTGDVICSTGRDLMNPDGTSTGKYISVKSRLDYHELLKHNSINCSSVLILREVALEFPMEHDDSHEDYITWLKVVRKYGHATGINRPLSEISSVPGRKVKKQSQICHHDLSGVPLRWLWTAEKCLFLFVPMHFTESGNIVKVSMGLSHFPAPLQGRASCLFPEISAEMGKSENPHICAICWTVSASFVSRFFALSIRI